MCLVVLAWRVHPDYRLLLAANRDEFHARPAAPLGWWDDEPSLLAGRDLEAGGSWLAAARHGRFATVTNYRETSRAMPGALSRGSLVTGFVLDDRSPLAWLRALDGGRYAGFSLLVATLDSLAYASNRGDPPRELRPGIYGLSNASLDTPWHKVERSKARLARLLERRDTETEALFSLLADRETTDAENAGNDGLPPPLARAVTAPFIVAEAFGTRCSTLLAVTHDGEVDMEERRYDSAGEETGRSRHAFAVKRATA